MIGQGRPNAEPSAVATTLPWARCASRGRRDAPALETARLDRGIAHSAPAIAATRNSGASLNKLVYPVIIVMSWLLGMSGHAAHAAEPSLRLRMEWGGGREETWRGKASVTAGALAQPTPLGIEADEPGSMWIVDGALQIEPRSARSYDGVDFTVEAPLTSALRINLSGGAEATDTNLEIPLAQLAQEPFSQVINPQGGRLLIRRVPGDRLRVKLARDSVVYSVGEVAEVEVQPHLLGAGAGGKVLLVAQLFPARTSRDPVWSAERELPLSADGSAIEPAILAVKLPEVEGVYDLHVAVHRRALQNRLGWKQTVETRKVQFVALAKERPAPPTAATLPAVGETLFEMDPASPPWWEKLSGMPLIPGLRRGPLGNGDAKIWQHALGPLIQLGPGGREPNVSWEAFPLPVARPGQPHIVEVEYPTDVAQTMGISVVEPNVAGRMTPIGLDTGIYVPEEAVSREPRLARHRVVFWPRTKTPLLLVTNQRDGSHAAIGKVRVIGPKASVVSSLGRDAARPTFLPRAFPTDAPRGDRLLAGYYDRPLFPENFSANEAFDDWSGRGLDDWVTFYEGATRLVEYLQYVGYNGLVITVLADGSTIYPSRLLEPTPRYDTGAYFVSGQDPYRKDILELLFRLFDREGMQLVPALQFSAPLPALEAVKRDPAPESAGITPIGLEGKPWLATHDARKGLGPYYNPLHIRVQDEMLAVVRELCDRYQQHPSFSALSVQLAADGYAQLPGADWSYDEHTVSRFVREKGLQQLVAEDHATRVQLIASEYRGPWLEWRAQALHQLHRRMHAELAQVKDHPVRLYLAGAHLFERPDIQQALRPSLRSRANAEGVLLSLGIDPRLYQAGDEVVLLRPQWLEPLNALTEQGVELELNQSVDLDRALRARSAGAALFFHEPQQLRLASFDAKSPFKGAQTLLVGQPSPAGATNRQRFVHAVATLDAAALVDGGWLMPLGQEDSLVDLVAAYRELPDAPFETIANVQQPVTIRRYASDEGTYVYFTNDSPWQARVSVEIDAPNGCTFDRFGKTRRLPPPATGGTRKSWVVDLEPYELLAGKFAGADVALHHPQVSMVQDVDNELYLRIRDLGERVAALQQPQGRKLLDNAGFELPPDIENPLPGWELREQAGATADFVSEQKKSGEQSLRLVSTQGAASLVSAPFVPLRSGHLAVLAWLRVESPQQQPPLRLAVSGRWKGQEYYRYAPIGAGTAQSLGAQWTQFLFEVRDLPTEQLTDLQVRFDLTGPGEVWIDDVELREFDEQEIREMKKLITVASYTLESRQIGDCLRLLESYWPRFLVANVPLTPGAVAARPRYVPKHAETLTPTEEEAKPGLMERVRRAMPSILR